jgi:hypothetical protein
VYVCWCSWDLGGGRGPPGGSDDAAHQGRAPSACPPHRFVCSVVPCDSILNLRWVSFGICKVHIKVNKAPRRNCPGPCRWSRLEEAGTSNDGYVQLVNKMVTVNSQRRPTILIRVLTGQHATNVSYPRVVHHDVRMPPVDELSQRFPPWCPAGAPASPEGAHIASPASEHLRLIPLHSCALHCHVTAQSC